MHEIFHGIDHALGTNGLEVSKGEAWLALDTASENKITGNAARKPVEHLIDALNVLSRPVRDPRWEAPSGLATRAALKRTAEPVFEFARKLLAVRLPDALSNGSFERRTTAVSRFHGMFHPNQPPLEWEQNGAAWLEDAKIAWFNAVVHSSSAAIERCMASLERAESDPASIKDPPALSELRELAEPIRDYLLKGKVPTVSLREMVIRHDAQEEQRARKAKKNTFVDWLFQPSDTNVGVEAAPVCGSVAT